MIENKFRYSTNSYEAAVFYEKHADSLDNVTYFEKLTDLDDKGIDMNLLRAYCRVGKNYSHARFMEFIARLFDTTTKEMKLQWKNI